MQMNFFNWLPWRIEKRMKALEDAVYGNIESVKGEYSHDLAAGIGWYQVPDVYNRHSLRQLVARLMFEAKLEGTYTPGTPPSMGISKKSE